MIQLLSSQGTNMAWYNIIDNTADASAARNACNRLELKAESLKASIESTTHSIQKLITDSEYIFEKSHQRFEKYSVKANKSLSNIEDAVKNIESKKAAHDITFNKNIIKKGDAENGTGSILVAGSSGGIAAVGAYTAVGILGTASTGSAIGTLGGVAATNATLAWFGGGAIAAGGGGMAVGTAVLGGIVAAPILFVAASQAKRHFEKNKTVADKYCKELETEHASLLKQKEHISNVSKRIDKKVEFLDYVSDRLIHYSNMLNDLDIVKSQINITKSENIVRECCVKNINQIQSEAIKVLSSPIIVDGEMKLTGYITVNLDEVDIKIIKKSWNI